LSLLRARRSHAARTTRGRKHIIAKVTIRTITTKFLRLIDEKGAVGDAVERETEAPIEMSISRILLLDITALDVNNSLAGKYDAVIA
jgi:hypothetical protein